MPDRVDRIRASLEAFNRTGEITPGLLAPEFELHQASSIVDTAGVFHGAGAFEQALAELAESFESLRFEPERFAEAPSGEVVVVVSVRGRGRGSGMEIHNRIAWVWTFDGERVGRLEVYEDPAAALERVGL